MERRKTIPGNIFLTLIENGQIRNLEDLKRSYRRIVMRTHPDAAGSDRNADAFVRFSKYYEDAKKHLAISATGESIFRKRAETNHRLRFFQSLKILETIDMPYSFHRKENEGRIRALHREAAESFGKWNAAPQGLFHAATREYERIWSDKPSGPYMKHALALNLRPILHNIMSFHLTGREVYRKQARQNIAAILDRLAANGYAAFREYLTFLMGDMKNGAAVFDDTEI
jgi:hypothetical protein